MACCCCTLVIGAVILLAAAYFFFAKKKKQGSVLTKEYQGFELMEKKPITQGVAFPVTLFRFKLPEGQSLGLPVGQHISLKCDNPETGKPHLRSYTPTTSNDDKGFFDLIIKVYPSGVMGQYLSKLSLGEKVQMRGPNGRFTYESNKYQHLCMIAGGSGITPMYQIASFVAKSRPQDRTKVSLLNGNMTADDIILDDELRKLAGTEGVSIYNVLNNPPAGWKEGSGFITQDHIREHFPPPSAEGGVKVLLCGPPPMLKAMQDNLKAVGFEKDQIFQF